MSSPLADPIVPHTTPEEQVRFEDDIARLRIAGCTCPLQFAPGGIAVPFTPGDAKRCSVHGARQREQDRVKIE